MHESSHDTPCIHTCTSHHMIDATIKASPYIPSDGFETKFLAAGSYTNSVCATMHTPPPSAAGVAVGGFAGHGCILFSSMHAFSQPCMQFSYMLAYSHPCMHIYPHIDVHMFLCMYTHVRVYACMYVCMYAQHFSKYICFSNSIKKSFF